MVDAAGACNDEAGRFLGHVAEAAVDFRAPPGSVEVNRSGGPMTLQGEQK